MQKLGAPSALGLDADASVEVTLTPLLTAIAAIDYYRRDLNPISVPSPKRPKAPWKSAFVVRS